MTFLLKSTCTTINKMITDNKKNTIKNATYHVRHPLNTGVERLEFLSNSFKQNVSLFVFLSIFFLKK